jgi:hypothetical protein
MHQPQATMSCVATYVSGNLTNNAVATAKVVDSAITTAKLADSAITSVKVEVDEAGVEEKKTKNDNSLTQTTIIDLMTRYRIADSKR